MTRYFVHNAMATQFQMWLCGEDADLMRAVAFESWAEVDRIEYMMSRHDPQAELARINREAHRRPVRVEVELFNVLQDSVAWSTVTKGYFDISFRSSGSSEGSGGVSKRNFVLNPEDRTVHFTHLGVELDLGGYGKGYALDRIAGMLKTYGIQSAFMQSGTSSALALGLKEDGHTWMIKVPHFDDAKRILYHQALFNQGFSYSATTHVGSDAASDIVNPHDGRAITHRAACCMVTPNALQAEVLSTAFLAMGKEKACRLFQGLDEGSMKMKWI